MFTNIYYHSYKNKLYLWELDNGRKKRYSISPKFNYYLKDNTKKSDIKDIFGTPVVKKSTSSRFDLQQLMNSGTVCYEAKIPMDIKYLHEKYDDVRKDYPDLTGEEFEKLANICTEKEQEKKDNGEAWKGKYPDIKERMPFTGVALAFEEKRWKPKKTAGVKNEIMALIFEERVELAYSLKQMDIDIEDLPEIIEQKAELEKIVEYFDYFDINSLKEDICIFEEA